ncbi:hypothetical protein JCM25156A_07870 [Komagataeibacter kakiaceti JCM 25156]
MARQMPGAGTPFHVYSPYAWSWGEGEWKRRVAGSVPVRKYLPCAGGGNDLAMVSLAWCAEMQRQWLYFIII